MCFCTFYVLSKDKRPLGCDTRRRWEPVGLQPIGAAEHTTRAVGGLQKADGLQPVDCLPYKVKVALHGNPLGCSPLQPIWPLDAQGMIVATSFSSLERVARSCPQRQQWMNWIHQFSSSLN